MSANPTQITTGKVRLSFPHLFEPHSVDPNEPAKYSVMLLIPKTDSTTVAKLRSAQRAALEAGKHRFGGKIPSAWHDTIKDGDEEFDTAEYPEYEGMLVMNVSSKTRPGVVDRAVEPILDQTAVYSGVYARVQIGAFAYNTRGNKGVSFGLNHVQILEDGPSLSGSTRPEDVFDVYEEDTSADDGASIL